MDEVYNLVCDDSGIRLDKYVSQQCPELSRTQTQKLIGEGFGDTKIILMAPKEREKSADRAHTIAI